MTLLYRVARRHADVVFRDELDTLAAPAGRTVHYLVGARGPTRDPLDAAALDGSCRTSATATSTSAGPSPMMQRVEAGLRDLGLPRRQIHAERFAY